MAVQPGTYNISLQRRADYYVTLQFKDATDDAFDPPRLAGDEGADDDASAFGEKGDFMPTDLDGIHGEIFYERDGLVS